MRVLVRLALHLYFGRIHVDVRSAPPSGSTLLLACNHPNSFLDALVIATHLPQRMRFLARGDVFRTPPAAKALSAPFMIPIYRISEGRTELRRTSESFQAAQHALAQRWSVLVFSEGNSKNEPELRPLGKGTARIALRAWESGLDVQVLPVWLHYGNFHRPYMNLSITTGELLDKAAFKPESDALFLRKFNGALRERLLATSRKADAHQTIAATARTSVGRTVRWLLLFPPALLGLLMHAPWYFSLRAFTAYGTKGNVFHDSILFTLLLLTYPFWLIVLLCIGLLLGCTSWAVAIFVIAPLSALALRKFAQR